ncbi:sulfotransferase family protein [Trinickia caryophylli]|uniref:Sulfotransferase family protein n=1 Tax=Trinickia caryophylli TaxID=28094 RepID=A0A1X7H544_TRICW|nr:sulfotransferase family protein [Trinickia caryophylli]PMS09601.1 hypothetical protein C0Z17_24185 [Trinickia caryophylli]TRX17265.1 sulfotransferase [Trinickia caryophylli]WQE11997.1 sulfotransferase [Trinickia caryophylli]SMF79728.1 hypothetical protein SAMN06295900_12177 [Trinickia caryophylli]GLU35610.1 hypothetical protein Busp01_54520 [Trinickia caryophylli]
MSLKVIGAGLGRTGTLSLKLALEHIGFGPCYHAMEIGATLRRSLPLWLDAIHGEPDWDAIFDGYAATVDYPACCFWPVLLARFPDARVILSVRDADGWFDSVQETIFSPRGANPLFGTAGRALSEFLRRDFGERIADRAFMTDYFRRWNQAVVDSVPAEQLLVFPAEAGWEPLCAFLGVPVPNVPYPRLHERKTRADGARQRALPSDPAELETRLRAYLDSLSAGS